MWNREWNKLLSVCLSSGLMTGFSYVPFPSWALFFCLTPLLTYWLCSEGWKKVFISGCLTSFIIHLIVFHWIPKSAQEFSQIESSSGWIIYFIYSLMAGLFLPIAGVIWWFFRERVKMSYFVSSLVLALLFLFWEDVWPLRVFSVKFGDGLMVQHAKPHWNFIHLAEWVGFAGLGGIAIFVNAFFSQMFFNIYFLKREKWGFYINKISVLVFVFVLFSFLGTFLKKRHSQYVKTPREVSSLRLLLIQPNISNELKRRDFDRERQKQIVYQTLHWIRKGLEKNKNIDLVILPETAWPEFLNERYRGGIFNKKLRGFLQEKKINLLTGGYAEEKNGKKFNAATILRHDGVLESIYKKNYLLSLTERDVFLSLGRRFFGKKYGLSAGKEVIIYSVSGVNVSPQICYESLSDKHFRRLVDKGSEVIVNLTNDNWFSGSEPWQHYYKTMARSIEFRRPVIRVTNGGISGAFSVGGEEVLRGKYQESEVLLVDVPIKKSAKGKNKTFFAKYGGYFPYMYLVLISSLLGIQVRLKS